MLFRPKTLPPPHSWPISGTFVSQHFPFFDNRRKIESRKTRFVARPPLSRLRRRFAPLRGTQRRCAGASRHPSGALRAQRAARAPFYEREQADRDGVELSDPATDGPGKCRGMPRGTRPTDEGRFPYMWAIVTSAVYHPYMYIYGQSIYFSAD